MAGNEKQEENEEIEIKMEDPQFYVEKQSNGHPDLENVNQSNAEVPLWTSEATSCLINQYKKFRFQVGQSTQIKSLREMFEMISTEMNKCGFQFSPQKCDNKWRVLERKYKNLVRRERQKRPGRMRHYGQWEHKRALDEIFNEKKRYVYMERDEDPQSSRYPLVVLRRTSNQNSNQQHEDSSATKATTSEKNEMLDLKQTLEMLFENFTEDMEKHFVKAEKNKGKRHKEKMALRQKDLELKKQLVKLKQQKIELQRCQIIAAAEKLGLNI